jgi:hypothetical protein
MIRSYTFLAAGLPLLWVAAGCATGPPKSGFLTHYEDFIEAPPDARIWQYVKPGGQTRQLTARIWVDRDNAAALANYDRFMVDPVVVQLRPDAAGSFVRPVDLDGLTRFMHEHFVSTLEQRYPVVEEPGEGVLHVRRALTDVYPGYAYLSPQPDNHPVKTWANSQPGGACIEGEAIDSVTGERIIGIIALVRGSYYDASTPGDPWRDAKRSIEGADKFFREIVDDAHAGKLKVPES